MYVIMLQGCLMSIIKFDGSSKYDVTEAVLMLNNIKHSDTNFTKTNAPTFIYINRINDVPRK